MTLRESVKELCRENNISINKLETELGFAQGYISKLDKSNPNTAKLMQIANYFNVTLEYLMRGKQSNERKNERQNNINMTVFERIESLRKARKISQGKLEKELGFSNGSISKWKNSMPTPERLRKLADYFNVSIEYLLTGEKPESDELNSKDESDIAKDLENIMNKIKSGENRSLHYNGEEIDKESLLLLEDALNLGLRRLKNINKEKYSGNKNK